MEHGNPRLANELILDELFDLTLYQELHKTSRDGLRQILEELIPVEQQHFKFWQDFFGSHASRLNLGRRLKLWVVVRVCRLFGPNAVHLVLEAIEIYGVRKYLSIWDIYKGTPLGSAVKQILSDEFKHEDAIVSQMAQRKIDPERIRSIFLGFNDGLVEILGAVSGFFAAFSASATVLVASFTVAVAGSLSMAAGAFVASSSEKEIQKIEQGKAEFLGASAGGEPDRSSPLFSALLVGVSYFIGALVPVLPVVFGAKTIWPPLGAAGGMITLVSLILAFLSGMEIKKRILINLIIMAAAVGVTYAIGVLARNAFGVNI